MASDGRLYDTIYNCVNRRKANPWQMALDGRLDDSTYELAKEEKLTLGKWHKMVG